MALAKRKLALAEPVPFTLAKRTTKSFTLLFIIEFEQDSIKKTLYNTCYRQ
jgi:hypothetical protein